MSLEVEKLKREISNNRNSITERFADIEVKHSKLSTSLANFKNTFTSRFDPVSLKLKKHLQWHDFWYKFFKYLIGALISIGGFISWTLGLFKDIFK